jgi:acyl dehydratase
MFRTLVVELRHPGLQCVGIAVHERQTRTHAGKGFRRSAADPCGGPVTSARRPSRRDRPSWCIHPPEDWTCKAIALIMITMTLDTEVATVVPLVIDLGDLDQAVGAALGPGPWMRIEQDQIDAFADATGDHQWIHVDRERAADGPFGRTIAHGYLTLSLVPMLMAGILDVTGRSSGVNYGIDTVRFVNPVPEGGRIRMRGTIVEVAPRSGGVQYRLALTVELEGVEKPAMVGEFIVLAFP